MQSTHHIIHFHLIICQIIIIVKILSFGKNIALNKNCVQNDCICLISDNNQGLYYQNIPHEAEIPMDTYQLPHNITNTPVYQYRQIQTNDHINRQMGK